MVDGLEMWRLAVAALTPVVTGIIGVLILRMGARMEHSKTLHEELLRKRLTLYEEVAPKLNDVYCFFQALGHWSELNPQEIILRKRAIDRALHVNRFLFGQDVWPAYREFEDLHFELYANVGKPAKLRLDVDWLRERLGEAFKSDWAASASDKHGDHNAQRQAYERLMNALGRSVAAMG